MTAPPTLADIEAAQARTAPILVRTPLLRSEALDEAAGAQVWVKAECLQSGGAFKLRGAYNRIAALSPQERARGVLAFSSGNHAIGVAIAAKAFAIPAVLVMPADAPRAKRARVAELGGEIVTYDRVGEDRVALGAQIAAARGLPVVPPFDDPFVMAGQGVIGLEIADDMPAPPDLVLAPASGGGLAAGVAIALAGRAPGARVVAVEPEGHDDLARSLAAGARRANSPGVRSLCDALMAEQPGALPFAAAQACGMSAVSVSDAETLAAMAFAFTHLKLVLEPGGAAALGAVLAGKARHAAGARARIVAIASGGNVDAEMFARALQLTSTAWRE